MSSKKDPKIAEMGKAIFEALGFLQELNETAFNAAFSREARKRQIHLRDNYFYNLRRWVESDVTRRINCHAEHLTEDDGGQEHPHQEEFNLPEEQQRPLFQKAQQLRLF